MAIGQRPIQDCAIFSGPWTTTRVPNGCALQVHLLSIPKWVTTLGASGTRRVEVVVIPRLQHLAANVAVAVGTLYPKLGLVVLLAVGEAVLSHVLPMKNSAADSTLEAPDVPLLVQGNECLALHQLFFASGTFRAGGGGGAAGRLGVHNGNVEASLAEALLPCVGDALPGREGLSASGTREALLMIGVPEGRHHLALHVEAASGAPLAEVLLVTLGAVVILLPREESALS